MVRHKFLARGFLARKNVKSSTYSHLWFQLQTAVAAEEQVGVIGQRAMLSPRSPRDLDLLPRSPRGAQVSCLGPVDPPI